MIFSRCTDQAWTADVDFLDGFSALNIRLCHGLLERVEIYDDQFKCRNFMFFQRIHVIRPIMATEDACENFGMQGFNAAVHHFREVGVIRDISHRDTSIL